MCWNAINIHWNNLKNDRSPFALHIHSYMHSHVRSHVFDHALSYVFDHAFNYVSLYRPFIWSIWFFLLFMSAEPQSLFWDSGFWKIFFFRISFSIRSFGKKKIFDQNFMLRLILHAKTTAKHEVRIYENDPDQDFHSCSWSNLIFEVWWFMKSVKPSSTFVLSWFDGFFRSIYSDVLTLMIFVLMKRFRASQRFFLIITSAELFFSFIHLILVISRFS